MTPTEKKHNKCPLTVVVGPFGPHYAKLQCAKHHKMIYWLNKDQVEKLKGEYDLHT